MHKYIRTSYILIYILTCIHQAITIDFDSIGTGEKNDSYMHTYTHTTYIHHTYILTCINTSIHQAITIDFDSIGTGEKNDASALNTVTLRERDSVTQVNKPFLHAYIHVRILKNDASALNTVTLRERDLVTQVCMHVCMYTVCIHIYLCIRLITVNICQN